MKPNRTLDALVAEKIFGWENNKEGPTFFGSKQEQVYADSGDWKVIDCLSYSTNIEDAWEVVERLRDQNRVFCLATVVDHSSGGSYLKWVAKWEMHDPGYRFEFAFHEDACMAICLASLRAIGVEV